MTPAPFSPPDIDALLFDMDGTLIDTDDRDTDRWAGRLSFLYPDHQRARQKARGLVMALETPVNAAFTALDWVGLDIPAIRLMVILQGGGAPDHFPPAIEGVEPLIERLAGRYRLGIVSTRSTAESGRILASLGLREHFEVITGRDTTWHIKPHPQPVLHAAAKLGVDPRHCLMIGDTTVDIRAGRKAGAWTCGVLCGYGQRRELEQAGAHLILEHTGLLDTVLL